MPALPTTCVLLVHAEARQGNRLKNRLLSLRYGLAGPGAARTPAAALARFGVAQPPVDVLLVGVSLHDGRAGIALARTLQALRPVPVVFVSALTDATTFALVRQLGPAAFLSTLSLSSTLEYALALAVQNFGAPAPLPAVPLPLAALLPNCVFVRNHGRVTKLCVDDIHHVEAGDRYCTLHTTHGRFLVRLSLREVLAALPSQSFVQIQRSVAVNAAFIEHFNDGHTTVKVAGTDLPVGRSHRPALLGRLRMLGC